MKKLIITCALLTSASLVASAQTTAPAQTTTSAQPAARPMPTPPTPEQRAERMARNEEKQLGLTPEQYKSVYNAELDYAKKFEALRSSGTQLKREDVMALRSNKDEQVKKILTPEQLTKYEAMTNRQHPGPAPMAPGAPAPTK